MKFLIIDLKGKFGSFKKFYSNSSVLTYFFPPRTTITGILAGILGREKESYHEEFCNENINIAVSIRNQLKKNIHKINYLKVESLNDLNGSNKNSARTQVPFEMLSAANSNDLVVYRLYLKCNDSLYGELLSKLTNNFQTFPVYLGKAGLTASAELIADNEIISVKKEESSDFINISTVVPKSGNLIADINFNNIDLINIYEEKMPLEFEVNERRLKSSMSFVFANGENLCLKLRKEHYNISYNGYKENIYFMEE